MFVNIIISFSIYLLIGQSAVLYYNNSKFFNISIAAIMSLAGYLVFSFSKQLNIMLLVSITISIVITIILSLLLEILIFKKIREKKSQPLFLLIVSLGIYIVLQNSISLIWNDAYKSIVSDVNVGNDFFGMYISDIQILTIFISITIFIIILLFIKYHKVGKAIKAVGSNVELANIFGINSDRALLCSSLIGSGLAATAGILVALDTGLTPTMGFNLLLYGMVAMIIGGIGSTWGLVGGALLLATAQHFCAFYINSKWIDVIVYAILILFMIWKPLGFSGKQLKKIEI